ncbi:MAG: S24/S26 family peptidase [Phocaeicola sp.]|nr:S24/S26 family peptidase [Phocaeicola sp.]MDY5938269.1 S24/S26 family peptidase [Phocaeicola sp.]
MNKFLYIENDIFLAEIVLQIKEGNKTVIIARGNSMRPFIMDRRDQLILAPVQTENLHVGQCVLATTNLGKIVLHRIIKKQGDQLTLCGDGNWNQLEYTSTHEVLGVLHGVIRKGRTYYCTGRVWRFYSWCWTKLYPIRRWLIGIDYRTLRKWNM